MYVVLTNFNNTWKDQVVGAINWGFDRGGTVLHNDKTTNQSPTINSTNFFSANYPPDPDSEVRLTSATRNNIFVEQATSESYKVIYVANPLSAYGVGPEFTKLQSFTRFTYDSLLCHDSLRKEAVIEWMNMVYRNDQKRKK